MSRSGLHASFFGPFRLQQADQETIRLSPGLQSLVAFLAFHRGQPQLRERLLELFWGHSDPLRGRSCLASALWRSQRALRAPADQILQRHEKDYVCLREEAITWSDVDEVVRAAPLATAPGPLGDDQLNQLERSLQLLARGPLLENQEHQWLGPQRLRFDRLRTAMTRRTIRHHLEAGQPELGLVVGEEYLDDEPAQEAVHQDLIRLELAAGRPSEARQRLQRCRRALREDLGVDPSPATTALLDRAGPSTPRRDVEPVESLQVSLSSIRSGLLGLLSRVDQLEKLLDPEPPG